MPKGTIFIKGNFREVMNAILNKYKPEFAFIDDGHTPKAVSQQLELCHINNVKYLAVHDTNKRKVRRGLKFAINRNMYKIIFEMLDAVVDEEEKKGITFMERIK